MIYRFWRRLRYHLLMSGANWGYALWIMAISSVVIAIKC